jgi:hypothetical protein
MACSEPLPLGRLLWMRGQNLVLHETAWMPEAKAPPQVRSRAGIRPTP